MEWVLTFSMFSAYSIVQEELILNVRQNNKKITKVKIIATNPIKMKVIVT